MLDSLTFQITTNCDSIQYFSRTSPGCIPCATGVCVQSQCLEGIAGDFLFPGVKHAITHILIELLPIPCGIIHALHSATQQCGTNIVFFFYLFQKADCFSPIYHTEARNIMSGLYVCAPGTYRYSL